MSNVDHLTMTVFFLQSYTLPLFLNILYSSAFRPVTLIQKSKQILFATACSPCLSPYHLPSPHNPTISLFNWASVCFVYPPTLPPPPMPYNSLFHLASEGLLHRLISCNFITYYNQTGVKEPRSAILRIVQCMCVWPIWLLPCQKLCLPTQFLLDRQKPCFG